GSDFGVYGGPTANTSVTCGSGDLNCYKQPHAPVSDPLALLPKVDPQPNPLVPPLGLVAGKGTPCNWKDVADGLCIVGNPLPPYGQTPGADGCPDLANGCAEYTPGTYANGIQVKGVTAIFDPGIYYVQNTFAADSNSCLRPS